MKADNKALANYLNIAALGIDALKLVALKPSNDEFTLRKILEGEAELQKFLSKLDKNISVVISVLSKKKMRDTLLSNPFSACWEFETAAYFISKGASVCPEPKTTRNSNTDFLVKLCGKDVFVEAHARRLKKKEEQGCGSAPISRYLKETMLEKMQQNGVPENLPHPLILAIDGEYAAMDTIAVEAAFHQFGADVNAVSAILLKNGGYYLIANSHASNQLSKGQVEMIL